MRTTVIAALALVLGACATSQIDPTREDVRARHQAWEELARADTTPPGSIEHREGWIENVDVNALRLEPVKPGQPQLALALPDTAVITDHGARISRAELNPGDEVRVSFSNRAGPMPKVLSIERVAKGPN